MGSLFTDTFSRVIVHFYLFTHSFKDTSESLLRLALIYIKSKSSCGNSHIYFIAIGPK
jgi:hypothetical protein